MSDYKIVEKIPTVDDYIRIRLAAGLSEKSREAAKRGLPNSLFGVTATFHGETIGIGRVIGDGGCFFEIVDIAVLPGHQKRDVGARIMQALMGYIHEVALPSAYVSLIADHGTAPFYARFGFQPCEPPESQGMFLRVD